MSLEEKLILFLEGELKFEVLYNDMENIINYLEPIYEKCVNEELILNYNDKHTFEFLVKSYLKSNNDIYKKASFYELVYNVMNKSKLYNGKSNNFFADMDKFCLDNVPSYLLSDETENIIIDEIYPLSKTVEGKSKLKKIVREKCKEIFHLEKGKYPIWAQDSEWPVRNGKPCRFIGRHREYEKVVFEFIDIDTKEKVIIEQFY